MESDHATLRATRSQNGKEMGGEIRNPGHLYGQETNAGRRYLSDLAGELCGDFEGESWRTCGRSSPPRTEIKGRERTMAFVDDLELAKKIDRVGESFIDDLGLADEKPPGKKRTKGAFGEYGKVDASESKMIDDAGVFNSEVEYKGMVDDAGVFGPMDYPDTAWERAKRIVKEDIPRLLTLRQPSGPPVAAVLPEESMLAAA
jgi:hypothetical protein